MAELVVFGIVLGSIIALGAVGVSLIYGILRFANFAHGDMMTLGAYTAFLLVTSVLPEGGTLGPFSFGWPMLLAFIPAIAVTGGVAVAADRLVYTRLRRRGISTIMVAIASLGVAILVRSVVYMAWGADFRFYTTGLRPAMQLPFGIRLRPDEVFIFCLAIGLVALLYIFLERTRLGKALRATADNPDLARISGIDTDRMVMAVWVIGAGFAAVAGILLGIQSQLRPEMGWSFLLPLFAAVLLGGIGNPYGALVGGMVIGIVQQVSTYFLPPTYKPAVAFIVLIVMLLFRPKGLFGSRYA